ncbi:MAG: alpha-L-fucosidase [Bacteroidales bacterium]|nr:alpha-L-fucosidase [Bacteroidales bacterium]
MRKISLIAAALLAAGCAAPTARTLLVEPDDSPETVLAKAVRVVPTPQQLHALENGFAAFVHFGPNTFTGVEWGNGKEDPAVFELREADTDQWCAIFRDAGMKRVILTAKHHDGFALWPSRYTTHGVASSPYPGDVVKSLAASCRKYGLEFGFYLSPADLYQMEAPDGLYGNGSASTLRTIPRAVPGRPFADTRTFSCEVDDYNEYFMNQLFELLTEYGPVSEVWFDGAHPKRKGGQQYNYLAWKELIRTLAPDAVVFGKEDLRWCGNEAGQTREAEWNVIPYADDPATMNMFADLTDDDLGSRERLLSQKKPFWLHYQPAETDVSIRDGWFWRNDDEQSVRSADNVFDIWERSVGGNSILLLNVPPDRQGRISPRDSAVLAGVGHRIRETYGNDLLSGARLKVIPGLTRNLPSYEYTLPLAIRFNRFELRENLAGGERVESFALDVWTDGWQELARGTNIGSRRILRFPEQNALRLRVRILAARAEPQIASAAAYLDFRTVD